MPTGFLALSLGMFLTITHNVNSAFDDELRFVRSALSGRPMTSNCDHLVKLKRRNLQVRAYGSTTEA